MSWSFTKAIRRGAAGPPAAGDTITIEFENPDDPINHNRSQQWTYDGTTNWGQFVSMVQHETNAYVKHLNVQPTLTVRPGMRFKVIVNEDIVLDPYIE